MAKLRAGWHCLAIASIVLSAGCIDGGSATEEGLLTPDEATGLLITFSLGPTVPPTIENWCGFTWQAKSWHYTMYIRNNGNEPFVVSGWDRLSSQTGSFLPAETFVNPTGVEYFVEAYGSATIPAKQTVQADLCDAPINPSHHRYRLKNAAGASYESPTLRFLP